MRKSWGFKPRCASDSLQAHGTAALQAPLSMEFSRQEHWRVLSFFPPGHLSDPGIEPKSLMSPALAGRFFTTSATWEALKLQRSYHLIRWNFSKYQ